MSLMRRLIATALLLSVVLPLANATIVNKTKAQCNSSKDHFWYDKKSCCISKNTPHESHPTPPKDTSCPSSPVKYVWNDKKGCCLPSAPPPPQHTPGCKSGWEWQDATNKCCPKPTHPSPPSTPHPSPVPGGNGGSHGNGNHNGHSHNGNKDHDSHDKGGSKNHGGWRRSHNKSRSVPLCPSGLDACPISGLAGGDYECVDTTTELEQCGGCVAMGKGQDCTAISGAWNVGCERGSCVVYNCAKGYSLSSDRTSCVAN